MRFAEGLLDRVQGAGADVAVNDTYCADGQRE
jgi:hypothetical protein